jgi:signal transduction histidine kinase
VNRYRNFVIAAAAFTALAVLFGIQRYFAQNVSGDQATWSDAFIGTFVVWWSWGLVTPLIARMARSVPIATEPRAKLALHLPAALAVTVLHALLVAAITPQFYWRPSIAPIRDMFRGRLATALAFDTLIYFFILAVIYLLHYAAESKRREIAAAQLSETLARTQLHALQVQLQPHFLFNTLNSILALVHEDPARASVMIRKLSDLLRYCLATSAIPEVPLSDEIHFAKTYLDIQKVRFEERLNVEFAVDEDALDTLVPSFVLQPLVENAVKFSLESDRRAALIVVSAARRDGKLYLTVEDNGPGIFGGALESSTGVGVKTTRARLTQLYHDDQVIRFDRAPSGGTLVSISIPARAAAGSATT